MTQTDRLELEPDDARAPNAFRSILFPAEQELATREPDCFHDLNLDQVVDALVAGRDEYDLRPLFSTPAREPATIAYRHAVFRDLERDDLRAAVDTFSDEMRRVRGSIGLARTQHYAPEKERWFLDAAALYCDAVGALASRLRELDPASPGLQGLRDFLAVYVAGDAFAALTTDAGAVLDGLSTVRYTVRIKGLRVTVSRYEGEIDYGAEVVRTFERFQQGAVDSRLPSVSDSGSMDHVEARIAGLVARLYPDVFRRLEAFCVQHDGFVDPLIARFDREVQFYVAYLRHIEPLGELPFCYPVVADGPAALAVEDGFDLALAAKLAAEGGAVVCNGFSLRQPERVLVVTGPNQGGKTTFSRMFGQLHYLAALGVPVPGQSAHLFLADAIFTHYEREEDIATLRGKLDDELVRIRDIVEQATSRSVVVVNEIFASTTLADAVRLGTEVLGRIVQIGCPAVCVTFIDELSSLGDATVSMVADVAPDDPSRRTFRITRRPADGRAYASALAGKYGLSYERLRARVGR
jgi:DNA mismatch repair protein MutS